MAVITIFSGSFCKEELVIREVNAKTGYKLVTDKEIVAMASRASGISESKISRTFSAKTSVFNKFTHEKERSIAHLRFAVAEMLCKDNLLIPGFTSQLIPEEVTHVLRVCLIADMKFRTSEAVKEVGLHEKDALKFIQKHDGDRAAWIKTLFGKNDPWDPGLYDMIIPVDKSGIEEIAALIKENADKDVVRPTERSKKAVDDFLLGARVDVALAEEGHNVGVKARDGDITLTINKHVLMLSRLEEELKSIAGKVSGVKSVETGVGSDFYQTDIYRKYDFEMPSKVLLVDDEREFVQTLSERLLMRDMGSAVAYDGESALSLVKEDEPEVMILDLKMPGIDGIEVLRRVKETNPEIEVIILTGHGSDEDRKVCMELGAFAYLHKPVDIDVLSETLKKANEKVQLKNDQMKH
ncbi:MAG: response regulator [Deltaproteobacteria bacterium]|nr:response regulator [Deltaproteobacteria bacterium]MBW2117760.1 response regulator [Deltaproteobacteria bacterium]MBW2344087.1 response regulator [Deltaproteobacteria bacterium]